MRIVFKVHNDDRHQKLTRMEEKNSLNLRLLRDDSGFLFFVNQ